MLQPPSPADIRWLLQQTVTVLRFLHEQVDLECHTYKSIYIYICVDACVCVYITVMYTIAFEDLISLAMVWTARDCVGPRIGKPTLLLTDIDIATSLS